MERKKYFGTDGIRGTVGNAPITADFALKLGWAIGQTIQQTAKNTPNVLIGKDTRISGYMLESALEAGLSAAGCTVMLVGPMPTPGIAYMTQTLRADLGIVISASHNPFADNGIKLFSSQGLKIDAATELVIESFLEKPMTTVQAAFLGKATRITDATGRYIEFCKSTVPHHTRFSALKIIVDCANGAAYKTAPQVFGELGAKVIPIHYTPNGLNINDQCGSIHPALLQEKVLKEKADLGIALDGDGDRLIMVDHQGEIVDGDELLYVILRGLLANNYFSGGIVGTDMTNSGLATALAKLHIPFERVPVGDQHIIECLAKNKWLLGGEPSGHIIYLPVSTTADGTISALQVLLACMQLQMNLHDVKKQMKKIPQTIFTIPHPHKNHEVDTLPIQQWTTHCQQLLTSRGRVLIRPSGTEPVIRVMLEEADASNLTHIQEVIMTYLENEIKTLQVS